MQHSVCIKACFANPTKAGSDHERPPQQCAATNALCTTTPTHSPTQAPAMSAVSVCWPYVEHVHTRHCFQTAEPFHAASKVQTQPQRDSDTCMCPGSPPACLHITTDRPHRSGHRRQASKNAQQVIEGVQGVALLMNGAMPQPGSQQLLIWSANIHTCWFSGPRAAAQCSSEPGWTPQHARKQLAAPAKRNKQRHNCRTTPNIKGPPPQQNPPVPCTHNTRQHMRLSHPQPKPAPWLWMQEASPLSNHWQAAPRCDMGAARPLLLCPVILRLLLLLDGSLCVWLVCDGFQLGPAPP